ncbi:MAG: tetratricopeptide repeat protein [Pseudomonadota bacterium]
MTIDSRQPKFNRFGLAGVIAATLALGACAQSGADLSAALNEAPPAAGTDPALTQTPLQKATGYWEKRYQKQPHNATAALSYAKNLKALGDKRRSFAVLQQAAMFNAQHKGIASEYGRLALEFNQVRLANRLLTLAYDPAKPDWRVLSARGVALGKLGDYKNAVDVLTKARALAPDRSSVANNLAMAYVAMGEPAKAEPILRSFALGKDATPRMRKNLALVLGLQGRYTEAKALAAQDGSSADAYKQIDQVRRMVRLPEKSLPGSVAAAPALKPASTPAAPRGRTTTAATY